MSYLPSQLQIETLRPTKQHRMIIWGITVALTILAFVVAAAFPRVFTVVLIPLSLLRLAALWLQWREARVDQHGVRRRGALWATPWSKVESILQPSTPLSGLRLRTTDAKILPTGIPVEHAQALSEISRKPLLRDD